MPLAKHACPFCRFASMFPRGLLRHVLREHQADEVNGIALRQFLEGDIGCWCGKTFANSAMLRPRERSAWEKHLAKEGGVAQHVLGIKDEPVPFL